MNALSINNHELGIKEHNHLRVVTLKDVDIVHERPTGTARKRFNDNRKHFIDGEDYFVRKTDEARKEFNIAAPNGLILLTESGYLMLVKSFTDDLAWDVQRKLVKSYFRAKEELPPPVTVPAPITTVMPKTYKGEPVLTASDLEIITGIRKLNINYNLKHSYIFVKDVDSKLLKGSELIKFKHENRGQFINANTLNIIYLSGAEKMLKYADGDTEAVKERLHSYYGTVDRKNQIAGYVAPTMHSPNFGGNTERLMDLIDFLKRRLIEAENANDKRIEENGPNKADRLKALMSIIDCQKYEIMKNEKYQILSAGAAYGAMQFSRAIGDISIEREDQLRAEVHEVFMRSVQANKK